MPEIAFLKIDKSKKKIVDIRKNSIFDQKNVSRVNRPQNSSELFLKDSSK